MSTPILFNTTILPGHRIELTAPDLPEGCSAQVYVYLQESKSPKRRLKDILAGYTGGQSFQTGDQVDAYLRAERDSWDS